VNPRLELALLLEEKLKSSWERRKARLESIPVETVGPALARQREGLPLTLEEYVVTHLGFLPTELAAKSKQG
jgi:hypothetical protein